MGQITRQQNVSSHLYNRKISFELKRYKHICCKVIRGLEDIIGGVSQSRNVLLANVFYRLELIESYGTGIRRIIESYEGCLLKPVFAPAPASFVVTLPKMSLTDTEENLTDEDKVLRLLERNGEILRKDVEAALNCTKYPAIKVLNKLIDAGKITKTGSARAVKYTLAII